MSVTTAQLLALAKEAADLTNVTDYVTTATWTSWTNAAIQELHRFVTNKFRATYFRQYDFTLAEGESQVTLPANFWRLKGLDIDADTSRRREVLPYNFAERNQYRQDTVRFLTPFCRDRRYNLIGSSLLKIQAEEQASGSYRLYYVPKPRLLGVAVSIPHAAGDAVVASTLTWTFAALANPWLTPAIGDTLTVAGATNVANNASRTIATVPTSTTVTTDGAATNETFGAAVTASLAAGSIDPELEPYAEYLWLTAAIKSLVKEESFAQAKELKDQRNLIRLDLTESLETDQGGPATIIDTDGDGDWS